MTGAPQGYLHEVAGPNPAVAPSLSQKYGSRYGPLDPPYEPWNIDNHHASDEKTWSTAAPTDYVIDDLKPTPPKK